MFMSYKKLEHLKRLVSHEPQNIILISNWISTHYQTEISGTDGRRQKISALLATGGLYMRRLRRRAGGGTGSGRGEWGQATLETSASGLHAF